MGKPVINQLIAACSPTVLLRFGLRINNLLHIPDKGQVMIRYCGLCKALHKPYYAEFEIMLS